MGIFQEAIGAHPRRLLISRRTAPGVKRRDLGKLKAKPSGSPNLGYVIISVLHWANVLVGVMNQGAWALLPHVLYSIKFTLIVLHGLQLFLLWLGIRFCYRLRLGNLTTFLISVPFQEGQFGQLSLFDPDRHICKYKNIL